MATRTEMIERHKQEAPEDSYFQGFGGSSVAFETMVFSVSRDAPAIGIRMPYSFEVRIPLKLRAWVGGLEAIEQEYGCIAIRDWSELEDRISDD